MNLPAELQDAIEANVRRFNPSELKQYCEELSASYREGVVGQQSSMRSDALRCAYVATRMPATYAAASSVLARVGHSLTALGVESVLDLGAGPGTASWAAAYHVQGVTQFTLVERDASLISIGQTLARSAGPSALRQAGWTAADISSASDFPAHDVVMCSYVLSELPDDMRASVVEKAWASAKKALIILEPGTPVGFGVLRHIRSTLLAKGASILAPCPHALECPMTVSDWCHFAVRLERSKLHRYLKSGTHGYEDEKVSYIVLTRSANARQPYSRILRHPLYAPGSVEMTLCTGTGKTRTLSVKKNTRDLYKRARKVVWGDAWINMIDANSL